MASLDYEGLKYFKAKQDGQIANVEETSTASQAYATGEHFIWEGNVFKAITPIAQGDTFVQNTNCIHVLLGDEISELNSNLTDNYALIDGYYDEMAVGSAEQLISTILTEDQVPYNFRTSGGSADIGNRETDMVVGGTIAWNQLVQNGNFDSKSIWNEAQLSYAQSRLDAIQQALDSRAQEAPKFGA